MAGTVPKCTALKLLGLIKFIPKPQDGLETDSMLRVFPRSSPQFILPPQRKGTNIASGPAATRPHPQAGPCSWAGLTADSDAQIRWDQPCHGAWWHLLSFLLLLVAGLSSRCPTCAAESSITLREGSYPAHTGSGWDGRKIHLCSQKDPPGEGPTADQCCWKHLHTQPGLVGIGLDAAGDSPHPPPS